MSERSGNTRLFWGTALIVVVLDHLTKWWAVNALQPPHIPHEVWGNFLRFTLAFNRGAAFSMSVGEYSRFVFAAFAIVACVILYRMFRASPGGDRLRVLALALAFGGASGNLIDRFLPRGAVVDFIDIGIGSVRFWTFNIADTAVTFGAIMLAMVLWKEDTAAEAEPEPKPPRVTVDGEAA
ncbi:MAG: signal peptidase II [Gemmatimonadaceae bacterium]